MSTKRCNTCEYCDKLPEPANASICRADTPKAFLVPVQTLQGNGLQATTIWPQVNPDIDFCGKHSPALALAH